MDKDYYKERYRYRKSQGLCTSCGKEKAEEGYTKCHNCRIIAAKYMKKRRFTIQDYDKKSDKQKESYRKCKEQGICVVCKKAPAVVGVRCESCAEKKRISAKKCSSDKKYLYEEAAILPEHKPALSPKELRQQRIANKICTRCGKRYALPFRHSCYECLMKLTNLRKKNLASKTPAELEEMRKKNIAYQKEYARKRREVGICAKCGKRPINHSYSTAYCMECSIEERKRRAEDWRKIKASRTPEEQAILDANVKRARLENFKNHIKNVKRAELRFCEYHKRRIPKLSFDINYRKYFYNCYVTKLKLMDISFEDFKKDPVNLGKEIRMKYAEMRGLEMDYIKECLCLK